MKHSAAPQEFELLSKERLHQHADELLVYAPEAIDYCVNFVIAETTGNWHGRARAMMCRRLKHCKLLPEQSIALLDCILGRLESGKFSEQFKDQLRLAAHIDPERTATACTKALGSSKPHVQRYASWSLSLPQAEKRHNPSFQRTAFGGR